MESFGETRKVGSSRSPMGWKEIRGPGQLRAKRFSSQWLSSQSTALQGYGLEPWLPSGTLALTGTRCGVRNGSFPLGQLFLQNKQGQDARLRGREDCLHPPDQSFSALALGMVGARSLFVELEWVGERGQLSCTLSGVYKHPCSLPTRSQ